MKRLRIVIVSVCSVLIFAGQVFSQAAPNPSPTPTPTPALIREAAKINRNAFTITAYKLKLQFDLPGQSLGARGEVTVRNDSTVAQTAIPLQISSQLHWAAARLAGKDNGAAFSTHSLDSDIDRTGSVNEATITLPQPLAPGATVTLAVAYEGQMKQNSDRLLAIGTPPEVAKHSDWDQITRSFISLRGIGYAVWFPVILEPLNLSDGPPLFEEINAWKLRHAHSSMDLKIVVQGGGDAGLLLVNGQAEPVYEQATGDSVDDEAESHTAALGFNTPTLMLASRRVLTTPFLTVYYVPGEAGLALADQHANTAANTAKLMAAWFAPKQPRPFSIFQLQDEKDAAFECDAALLTPFTAENRPGLPLALAYSMTHAYFDSPRLWMREGVAWFMQLLEVEQMHGRGAALQYLEDQRGGLSLTEPAPEAESSSAANSLINSAEEIRFRNKAVFVWWMLRELAGEPALQRALQEYRPDQDTQAAYFQKLLEKESKKDLEWFFDDWIYRDRGLPQLKIDSTFVRKELSGAYMVTVTISNSGGAGAEVPVTVRSEAGKATVRIMIPGRQKTAARVEVQGEPVDATVNDGSVPETDPSDHTVPIVVKKQEALPDTGEQKP